MKTKFKPWPINRGAAHNRVTRVHAPTHNRRGPRRGAAQLSDDGPQQEGPRTPEHLLKRPPSPTESNQGAPYYFSSQLSYECDPLLFLLYHGRVPRAPTCVPTRRRWHRAATPTTPDPHNPI